MCIDVLLRLLLRIRQSVYKTDTDFSIPMHSQNELMTGSDANVGCPL